MGRSGPECRWRGAACHPAASKFCVRMEVWRRSEPVCQFRVVLVLLGHCTRSVGNALFCSGAPPRNGCSAPCLWRLWRLSGLQGSSVLSCLPLGLSSRAELSSAWGLPSAGLGLSSAWAVFCLGLCGASCCGSSEMSHAIPRHIFQTLKSHRWNCNVLGCCTKFGYPNCVRVLVEEAPKASSCVRSSSHDTVHNPRDASNTTPTPQNAKSPFTSLEAFSSFGSRLATHAFPLILLHIQSIVMRKPI